MMIMEECCPMPFVVAWWEDYPKCAAGAPPPGLERPHVDLKHGRPAGRVALRHGDNLQGRAVGDALEQGAKVLPSQTDDLRGESQFHECVGFEMLPQQIGERVTVLRPVDRNECDVAVHGFPYE